MRAYVRWSRGRCAKGATATLLALLSTGCANNTTSPSSACAAVAGQISTSSGGAAGLSNYALELGAGVISFSNVTNVFFKLNNGVGFQIADVGVTCLSAISAWPSAGTTANPVTVTVGHSYIVQFSTTVNGVTTQTYSKFKVDSYGSGVVTVTYVPHL